MKPFIPRILTIFLSITFFIPQFAFASYRSASSFKKEIKVLDSDVVTDMPIPVVLGVEPENLIDTYTHARSGGRVHNAIDIFAPRGALVASPTEAVVIKITPEQGYGGIQVWTANPGGEEYYFAHLSGVYPRLKEGDILKHGDLIGFVGNTGNAKGASPHLHFAIYAPDGTNPNPYPRLTKSFDRETRIKSLVIFIEYLQSLLHTLKQQTR